MTEELQEVTLIRQRAFRVSEERKGPYLRYLIKSHDMHQVLVFTTSIHSADHVADKLVKKGIDARATHGKKSHHARQQALADFKAGKLRVLATPPLRAACSSSSTGRRTRRAPPPRPQCIPCPTPSVPTFWRRERISAIFGSCLGTQATSQPNL